MRYKKDNDCDHSENNFRKATSSKTVHLMAGLKEVNRYKCYLKDAKVNEPAVLMMCATHL